MQSQILQKALIQLGFEDDVIQVYLLLLETKNHSVTNLTETTGFNRMKIYKILEKLGRSEMIEFKKDYKTPIKVLTPANIIAKLRSTERESKRLANNLSDVLPDLLSHFYNGNNSFCRVFSGKYQLIDLFDEMLDGLVKGDIILNFGEGKDFNNLVGETYIIEWMRKRVKKGIYLKTMIRKDNNIIKCCHLMRAALMGFLAALATKL